MNREEIEAFLAVTKYGTISRAAEALYVTQPALSRRIRVLEEELRFSLFKRGKGIRSIELTEEGEAFILLAGRWQSLWEETRSLAERLPEKQIRIAAIGSLNHSLLSPCYRRFLLENPGISLEISVQHPPNAYPLIENGEMDLALVAGAHFSKKVQTVPLFSEQLLLVSGDPMPEPLTPDRLDPAREIRFTWTPECESWRNYWFGAPKSKVLLDDIKLLEPFLVTGGWAIVPSTTAAAIVRNPALTIHPLRNPPPDRTIYYIMKNSCRDRQCLNRFLSIIVEELQGYPAAKVLTREFS